MFIPIQKVGKRKKALLENSTYYKTPYGSNIYDINNITYKIAEEYILSSKDTIKYDNGKSIFNVFFECCKQNGSDNRTDRLINYLTEDIIPIVPNFSNIYTLLEENSNVLSDKQYKVLSESMDGYLLCDRVIRNDDKLAKRFNIDKFIYENKLSTSDNIITGLCEFIDTYDINPTAKYNIALENIQYSLYKNNINTDSSEVISEITDYFLTRDMIMDDKEYKGIHKIVNKNEFVKPSVLKDLQFASNKEHDYYINKINKLVDDTEEPKIKNILKTLNNVQTESDADQYIKTVYNIIGSDNTLSKDNIELLSDSIEFIPLISGVRKYFIDLSRRKMDNTVLQGNDIKDYTAPVDNVIENTIVNCSKLLEDYIEDPKNIFSDFYDENNKDFSTYRLESSDFADSKDVRDVLDSFKQEQDKSPSRFSNMIRKLFTKTPESIIDSFPSIMSMVKGLFILSTAAIPFIGPVLAAILALVNKLITDNMSYKNTKKLIIKFENEKKTIKDKKSKLSDSDSIKKLDEYEKCIDQCLNKLKQYKDSIKDDDDSFDMDDDTNSSGSGSDDDFGDMDDLFESANMIEYMSNGVMELASLNKDALLEDISNNIGLFTNDYYLLEDFTKIIVNCPLVSIEEYSSILNNYKRYNNNYIQNTNVLLVSDNLYSYKEKSDPIRETLIQLEATDILNEGINLNNIKLGIQNFKKKIQTLSTKEKAMWKTVDAHGENLMNSLQKAMTSDRREAIIKGSVVPSLSKCCKALLAVAGTTVVGSVMGAPWLGLITAVGMFASSKLLSQREKNLIYDEIDTELKVVEKQIDMAQNDGDMNQYRFLLNYQKRLNREKLRIKYGKTVKGRYLPTDGGGGKN